MIVRWFCEGGGEDEAVGVEVDEGVVELGGLKVE